MGKHAAWILGALFTVAIVAALFLLQPDAPQVLIESVDPLIGSDSSYEFSHGNTFPAAALPFGMVHWTPQTGTGGWLYQYSARSIQGFRASHRPSAWMDDWGSFVVMPLVGEVRTDPVKRALPFSHSREVAGPAHYQVELGEGGSPITVDVVPTTRGGLLRFAFKSGEEPAIMLEVQPGPGVVEVHPEKRMIVGHSAYGGRSEPPDFANHFVAVFDRSFASHGVWSGEGAPGEGSNAEGDPVGAFVRFSPSDGTKISIRVATSLISRARAEANLAREIPYFAPQEVQRTAETAWEEHLGRIRIEGGTPAQRTTFYTALYRASLFPRAIHEETEEGLRHYSPFNGKVLPGPMYVDTGFWDTYRAQFPLLTLVYPERVEEILQGLVNAADEGEWLPKWPNPGYRSTMIGTHADSVIAEAYIKGLRGFPSDDAFTYMLRNGTTPGNERYEGRLGIERYLTKGYVPTDEFPEATARTLEFAYDDYCIGRFAEELGRGEEAELYLERAKSYRNVYDKRSGFVRGRNADGSWAEPFDPLEWGGPFTESCAWHYLWSVQQDVPGLIELLGGRESFTDKLDELLATPPRWKVGSYKRVIHEMREMRAGGMGQYAHANEPMHHVLYLYAYVGQPWKTQEQVRFVMDELYGDGPDGLLGDEDTGQMSAWYVFSAMGFYPVCPCQPMYVLGSPLFDSVTIDLSGGRTFTVRAVGNGPGRPFIQSAVLNGVELPRPWLWHREIASGGELVVQMGAEPDREWGSAPEHAPPGAMDQRDERRGGGDVSR